MHGWWTPYSINFFGQKVLQLAVGEGRMYSVSPLREPISDLYLPSGAPFMGYGLLCVMGYGETKIRLTLAQT